MMAVPQGEKRAGTFRDEHERNADGGQAIRYRENGLAMQAGIEGDQIDTAVQLCLIDRRLGGAHGSGRRRHNRPGACKKVV
jgi:hypothetical protein